MKILLLLFYFLLSSFSSLVSVYYGNWKAYQRAFPLCEIPFDKIDRLFYIFTDISDGECKFADSQLNLESIQSIDGRCSSPLQPEDDPVKGNIYQLKIIKQKYPKLKVFFVIGGMIYTDSMREYIITNDTKKMEGFVNSCVQMYNDYYFAFDGIDIDYEYPCVVDDDSCGFTPAYNEKELFANFVTEFRKQLGNSSMLSLATSAEFQKIDALDFQRLNHLVDIYNIMAYDLTSGSWGDTYTGHHAQPKINVDDPLYYRKKKSGDLAAKYFVKKGAKPEKINLGVAFYGRGFKISTDNQNNGPFCLSLGEMNFGTWEKGIIEYYDIKNNYSDSNFSFFDDEAKAPYIIDSKKGIFITFEDSRSIQEKISIVNDNGYQGLFAYEITGDDQNFTLLKTMRQESWNVTIANGNSGKILKESILFWCTIFIFSCFFF